MKLLKHAALCALAVIMPALATLPAHAQGTAEQRAACQGDAMKLCSKDIPDVAKIETCLRSRMEEVSPACRAEFSKVDKK